MCTATPSMAEQIGHAASALEHIRTGQLPKSVTVVLADDMLVIALRGVLTHAERAAANSEAGAAWVREYHQRLFENVSSSLLDEIKRITGVAARTSAEKDNMLVPLFKAGAIVQVFVLGDVIPLNVWSGSVIRDQT